LEDFDKVRSVQRSQDKNGNPIWISRFENNSIETTKVAQFVTDGNLTDTKEIKQYKYQKNKWEKVKDNL